MTTRRAHRFLGWRLLAVGLLALFASACCSFRERGLRTALKPYLDMMASRFANDGRCPQNLDGLGVLLDRDLEQEGNTLRGHGGVASYSLNPNGTCEFTVSGFSFCGICSFRQATMTWSCHH